MEYYKFELQRRFCGKDKWNVLLSSNDAKFLDKEAIRLQAVYPFDSFRVRPNKL